MTVWFILLILGGYLLGALPVAYLAAKASRGIDLREFGTGQVGTGNLWRMTASWKIGLPVGIFDFAKGALMVWAARAVGLVPFQQFIVGLAVIIGHDWSVFLRFGGGRGVGTAIGIIFLLPLINGSFPWTFLIFVAVGLASLFFLHRTPAPVLLGLTALPVTSRLTGEPLPVTLGYLALLFIIVIKRLTVPRSADSSGMSWRPLLLNRLLFDRDIRDRKVWMYRRPAAPSKGD